MNKPINDVYMEDQIAIEIPEEPLTLQELINQALGDENISLGDLVNYAITERPNEINTSYFPGQKTLLHVVAKYEQYDDIADSLLLDLLDVESINYNIQDETGQTPLHYAVRRGNLNNVNQLIIKGANTEIKDNNGCTVIDYALFYNVHDIIESMLMHGKIFQNIMPTTADEKTRSLVKVAQFADKVYTDLFTLTKADVDQYSKYYNLIFERIINYDNQGRQSKSSNFVGSVLKNLQQAQLQQLSETLWVDRVSQNNINQDNQRGI